MLYPFQVYRSEVEQHMFWVAKSASLKGCVGQGETAEEAIAELEEMLLRRLLFLSRLYPLILCRSTVES